MKSHTVPQRLLEQFGYWGATEQKTRLRIQATSTIESDGLRSGRNRHMATIRDRLGRQDRNSKVGVDKILAYEG
jgi:hypothetical protein